MMYCKVHKRYVWTECSASQCPHCENGVSADHTGIYYRYYAQDAWMQLHRGELNHLPGNKTVLDLLTDPDVFCEISFVDTNRIRVAMPFDDWHDRKVDRSEPERAVMMARAGRIR